MDIDTLRRDAEAPMIAGADTLAGVATDLADAFTNDIMLNWFFRTDARKAEAHQRFFRMIVDLAWRQGGRMERPACGGAAAGWMPLEAVGPMSLSHQLRSLPTLLPATGLARFIPLFSLREDIAQHHPTDPRAAHFLFLPA